jgi:hypothetical protein
MTDEAFRAELTRRVGALLHAMPDEADSYARVATSW